MENFPGSIKYDAKHWAIKLISSTYCTEVRFASFLSSGFTTMAVMNPPEKKLEKHTSVQWEIYMGQPQNK